MKTKRQPIWHTIFILNALTHQWEKVAEIKSEGLTNLFLSSVIWKTYGSENTRTVSGKVNTLPKSFYL